MEEEGSAATSARHVCLYDAAVAESSACSVRAVRVLRQQEKKETLILSCACWGKSPIWMSLVRKWAAADIRDSVDVS